MHPLLYDRTLIKTLVKAVVKFELHMSLQFHIVKVYLQKGVG